MKKLAIFKMLLEKYNKNKSLLAYLTDSEVKKLNSLPPFIKNLKPAKEPLIDKIHYSWFIPFLNMHSKKEITLFLLAMKPSYKKSLEKLLNIEASNLELCNNTKKFLQNSLLRSVVKKEASLLPVDVLFESKLNALLLLKKSRLIKLIDFLSMYDLAKALKYIVEKKQLKKIYSYLKPDEKYFLQTLLKTTESFTTQKINIKNYIEDKKKFKNHLHIRGLMRLAIALSGESVDLIWYICHYLDIGRGNYIFKECKKKKIPNVSDKITSHILKIINILNKTKDKL